MYNRNDDPPRWEKQDWFPPPPPEEIGYYADPPFRSRPPRRFSLREWIANLSSVQQLGYGCIVIMLMSATLVYCVGAATFVVRPMLPERAAIPPTLIVRPTLLPTPTQEVHPSFIALPTGQLLATPTQAPMPTRPPPTLTPTVEMVNGMTVTPSPSPTPTIRFGPMLKPSATPIARP